MVTTRNRFENSSYGVRVRAGLVSPLQSGVKLALGLG